MRGAASRGALVAAAIAVFASGCSDGDQREDAAPGQAAEPPLDIERIDDTVFRSRGASALAVGDTFDPRENAAVGTIQAEAPDTPVEVEDLPGVGTSGQRAEEVLWLGDHPVVVGSGADDPGRGAVVWWGLDGTDEWFRLAGDALGGPGYQQATGVASDGDTLVIVGSAPQGGAVWRAAVPPP